MVYKCASMVKPQGIGTPVSRRRLQKPLRHARHDMGSVGGYQTVGCSSPALSSVFGLYIYLTFDRIERVALPLDCPLFHSYAKAATTVA